MLEKSIEKYYITIRGKGVEAKKGRSRRMKKFLIITLALVTLCSVAVPAQAGQGGRFLLGLGLGLLIAPHVLLPPPPVYYHPYYPPHSYYHYYVPEPYGERVWVSGYWDWRWNPNYGGWERVWIPGFWR